MLVELIEMTDFLDDQQAKVYVNPRHVVRVRRGRPVPGLEDAQSFESEIVLTTGEVLRVSGSPTEVRKLLGMGAAR